MKTMKRFGSVTEVLPEKLEEYKRLHAKAWPGVLARITASNIRNYSIHLRTFDDGRHILFTYFEYAGSDFDADMAAIAADPETQRWWDVCKPCLKPFDGLPPGECWAPMEEVFYHL
jgi:L-rhamnose mutarotase